MHVWSQKVEKGGPSALGLEEVVKCARRKRQQTSHGACLDDFLKWLT